MSENWKYFLVLAAAGWTFVLFVLDVGWPDKLYAGLGFTAFIALMFAFGHKR